MGTHQVAEGLDRRDLAQPCSNRSGCPVVLLAGLVERVGDGERRAFRNEAQLLEYISGEKPKRIQKAPARNAFKKPPPP